MFSVHVVAVVAVVVASISRVATACEYRAAILGQPSVFQNSGQCWNLTMKKQLAS